MKFCKNSFIFLLFLAVIACDNEQLNQDVEDNLNIPENNLIGEWDLESFQRTVTIQDVVSETPNQTTLDVNSTTTDYKINFESDSYQTSGSLSYTIMLTENESDPILTEGQLNDSNFTGDYSFDASVINTEDPILNLTIDGVNQNLLINGDQTYNYLISDNGNTLTLNQNAEETIGAPEDETTIQIITQSIWQKELTDDEPTNACEEATTLVDQTESQYNTDTENVTFCEAYTLALENQIIACGDNDGSIQAIIDELGSCSNNAADYAIGDIGPAGGYVFYLDDNGGGLEIAPIETEFETQWGCYSTNVSGLQSEVGTGQANTNIILQYHIDINFYNNPEQCQAPEPISGVITVSTGDVAAKNCDDLVFNGFDDWYMPSIDELELVYTNLHAQGFGDFNATSFYGSSTQVPDEPFYFFVVDFGNDGNVFDDLKNDLFKHRAIRNF